MEIIVRVMIYLNIEVEHLKELHKILIISKIWDLMQYGFHLFHKTWVMIIMDMHF